MDNGVNLQDFEGNYYAAICRYDFEFSEKLSEIFHFFYHEIEQYGYLSNFISSRFSSHKFYTDYFTSYSEEYLRKSPVSLICDRLQPLLTQEIDKKFSTYYFSCFCKR